MLKKLSLGLGLLLIMAAGATAQDHFISSPDKKIKATVTIGKNISYSIDFKEKHIILPSVISISFADGTVLGLNPAIKKTETNTVNTIVKPLYGITATIPENYNELKIEFKNNYAVIFRVYNEGFAYRFISNITGDVIVSSERNDYHFADNYSAYFHPAMSESNYRLQKVSDYRQKPNYSSLPVLVKGPDGLNIMLHEADVFNYPCLTVAADTANANTLTGEHSAYPKTVEIGGYSNFNLVVKQRENYIAKTTGQRNFPWRLIAFNETDKDILSNQLVYLLAAQSRLTDTQWIKPGKVAWDWWNALNLSGVSFKTGFNTDTYKYYADFAAANGISYINLDEGWSDQFDLLKTAEKLNMDELVAYAKQKKVGIILWCVWRTLDRQMIPALDKFEKWGIAGLKVDFMDRDDQVVVEFHERLLKEAAKRKLLINFHGAYHPTGLSRTYPNNINVEGVKGLEWNKFDKDGVSPEHDVTIPFIRMFAGSMDYTPGAMQNYNRADWKQIFDRPMSQGTRCHQLAMYAVYYGPLQMLADAPTAYQKEPQVLKFLSDVSTIWDEVKPIDGAVGKYLCVARKKANNWYVGAMTNWDKRELNIKLDFLEKGKNYRAEIFADGINADRIGSDTNYSTAVFKNGDSIRINMAPGGGWVAHFTLLN
ncbi:glycoside hydrolase family 97 protein [Mucilaginibacter sp. AW1-3]